MPQKPQQLPWMKKVVEALCSSENEEDQEEDDG
jgi:hypothetical protein